MENQKEFDDLAKKVDSLLRIQKNLVREFKDNCHNPSPQLITSIQNLSTELKVVQDRLSKVKVDEGLPEPSIEFTPKIGVDLDVTPIDPKPVSDFNPQFSISIDSDLAGEGNYRSTKTQFSFWDEASSEVEVQKRNGNSTFLDYQEGKTFKPDTNLVVDFRSKRAGTPEVNDFNAFNLNYNDKPQQFEDWKSIDGDNIIRFTSVCVVLSSVVYTRLIFDRGRYLVGSIILNKYTNGFVYKLLIELRYGVELLDADSNAFFAVKYGDYHYASKLCDERRKHGSILWTVLHRFMLKGKYRGVESCGRRVKYRLGLARMLIDQLHHAGRGSGSGDVRFVILHLLCKLLNNLVTHSVLQGGGEVQNIFDQIADYTAWGMSRVCVWKIPLKELRYLQAILTSISTVVKGHTYLSEFGFLGVLLLTLEVYESCTFHEKVIMTVVYSTWGCFYSFYCAQHRSFGYNQLIGVCINALPLNFATSICGKLHDILWRIVSVLVVCKKGYIVRPLFILTYIPNVLMLVVFLKWKFKLFSTGPWGVGTVNENVSVLVVVGRVKLAKPFRNKMWHMGVEFCKRTVGVYIQTVRELVDLEWRKTKEKEAVLHREDLTAALLQHHFSPIPVQKFTFLAVSECMGTKYTGLVVNGTSSSIYQSQFNGVWVHTHGQVANFIGFAATSCLTEVYAVTFFIAFTYEVKVFTAVSEQPEWLAFKCFVPCQFFKLRHFNEYRVEMDITSETLKALALKQLGVPFQRCTPTSDKGRIPTVIHRDIVTNSKMITRMSGPLVDSEESTATKYNHCILHKRRQLDMGSGIEVRNSLTRVFVGIVATGLLICIRGIYDYLDVQQIEDLFGRGNKILSPVAFASFNSSFGCHGNIMIHQFEGKLIILVLSRGSKQRCSISISGDPTSVCTVNGSSTIHHILVTVKYVTAKLQMGLARVNTMFDSKLRGYSQVIVKEDIEQYKKMRDLRINLSSVEVDLAFLYWLVVQLCLYDLVLIIALKCAYTETYQAVKMKIVGLLAKIPRLRFELRLLWALKLKFLKDSTLTLTRRSYHSYEFHYELNSFAISSILEDKDILEGWVIVMSRLWGDHLLREDQMLFSKTSNNRRASSMCRYLSMFSLISFNLL